jgi:hypothetical protein
MGNIGKRAACNQVEKRIEFHLLRPDRTKLG